MAKSEAKQKFANSFLIAKMAKRPTDNNKQPQHTNYAFHFLFLCAAKKTAKQISNFILNEKAFGKSNSSGENRRKARKLCKKI